MTGMVLGKVVQVMHGEFRAQCSQCDWSIRQRDEDEEEKILRSHSALLHHPARIVYAHE